MLKVSSSTCLYANIWPEKAFPLLVSLDKGIGWTGALDKLCSQGLPMKPFCDLKFGKSVYPVNSLQVCTTFSNKYGWLNLTYFFANWCYTSDNNIII